MNRTRIEWVKNDDGSQGYTWNPIEGSCPSECWYCYAGEFRRRFKRYTGEPRLMKADASWLTRLNRLRKGSTVFVGSMMELFHPAVISAGTRWVINATQELADIRWLFLTKRPSELAEAIMAAPFPRGSWQGVTRTGIGDWPLARFNRVSSHFTFKPFVSFEPLLGPLPDEPIYPFRWVIIGSLNKNGKPVTPDKGGTQEEWVWSIIGRADSLGIPVFLKEELLRLYPQLPKRKEVPWLKATRQEERRET